MLQFKLKINFGLFLESEGVILKPFKDRSGVDVAPEEFVREFTLHRNS